MSSAAIAGVPRLPPGRKPPGPPPGPPPPQILHLYKPGAQLQTHWDLSTPDLIKPRH